MVRHDVGSAASPLHPAVGFAVGRSVPLIPRNLPRALDARAEHHLRSGALDFREA